MPAWSAGDLPLASCKGSNGTVTEHDEKDTARGPMRGIVTKTNLQEYCKRNLGDKIKQYGVKLTEHQCVGHYLQTKPKASLSAEANCPDHMGCIALPSNLSGGSKVRIQYF